MKLATKISERIENLLSFHPCIIKNHHTSFGRTWCAFKAHLENRRSCELARHWCPSGNFREPMDGCEVCLVVSCPRGSAADPHGSSSVVVAVSSDLNPWDPESLLPSARWVRVLRISVGFFYSICSKHSSFSVFLFSLFSDSHSTSHLHSNNRARRRCMTTGG